MKNNQTNICVNTTAVMGAGGALTGTVRITRKSDSDHCSSLILYVVDPIHRAISLQWRDGIFTADPTIAVEEVREIGRHNNIDLGTYTVMTSGAC